MAFIRVESLKVDLFLVFLEHSLRKRPLALVHTCFYMIENLLCLAVILRSSFENGRDPRGHPVGSPLDLFKPWSMAAAVGVA